MASRYTRDKRWVARIVCDLPARMLTHDGWLPVRLHDLSRTGARLKLYSSDVGIGQGSSVGSLARYLAELLPEDPHIELHHHRLGLLIGRQVHIVRLGKWVAGGGDLELGCTFDLPLDDDEVAALGLGVPREGESPEQAVERLRPAEPTAREPTHLPPESDPLEGILGDTAWMAGGEQLAQGDLFEDFIAACSERAERVAPAGWQACVSPNDLRGVHPFIAFVDSLEPEQVVLRVCDAAHLVAGLLTDGLEGFPEAFSDVYGRSVSIKLVNGATHAWSGRARLVETCEAREHPGELLLTFELASRLDSSEVDGLTFD